MKANIDSNTDIAKRVECLRALAVSHAQKAGEATNARDRAAAADLALTAWTLARQLERQ